MDMSLSKLQEMVKDMEAWHAAVHVVTELYMTERLNKNWFPALKFSAFFLTTKKKHKFQLIKWGFYDPTLPTRFLWHILQHKEGWAPKNWCFWVMLLEKTLESPLDSKETSMTDSTGMSLSQLWETVKDRKACLAAAHGGQKGLDIT